MEKQTAGRKALGDFAPQFAAFNDDVLFGEVWAKETELSLKLRSIATVSALVGKGIAGDALRGEKARRHEGGDGRVAQASRVLRWLAERLGRIPCGEGSLRGGSGCGGPRRFLRTRRA